MWHLLILGSPRGPPQQQGHSQQWGRRGGCGGVGQAGQRASTASPFPAPQVGRMEHQGGTCPACDPGNGRWAGRTRENQVNPDRSPGLFMLGHLSEDVFLFPSVLWIPNPLIPTIDPADDISEDRGSEANVDARNLGEPLVKRERSDPNHALQGL